jgi:hypothetical protein
MFHIQTGRFDPGDPNLSLRSVPQTDPCLPAAHRPPTLLQEETFFLVSLLFLLTQDVPMRRRISGLVLQLACCVVSGHFIISGYESNGGGFIEFTRTKISFLAPSGFVHPFLQPDCEGQYYAESAEPADPRAGRGVLSQCMAVDRAVTRLRSF